MKRGGDLGKVRFGSHRSFELYRETDAVERREVGDRDVSFTGGILAAARKKRDLSASFYFVIRFARSSLTRSVGISSLS